RIFTGLTKPSKIFGDVFVGTIEAIGPKVAKFKVGDEVFGTLAPTTGTHAEYICIREHKVVALRPKSLTARQAAALVDGPLTAAAFFQKFAKIQPRPDVLVNGATGSVGSAAVQLAKYFGATVTGVASTKNLELVRSLGADTVVDYTQQDFTDTD